MRLSNVQHSITTFSVYESNDGFGSIDIRADVVGDISRLNGQTIFVKIDDAEGLFNPIPTRTFFTTYGTNNSMTVSGNGTRGRVGHHVGTLRIQVCIDAACAHPIGDSPIQVPFDLTVLQGPTISPSTAIHVEATTDAAVDPVSGAVKTIELMAKLPEATASWNVFGLDFSGTGESTKWIKVARDPNVPGKFVVSFLPAPAGDYTVYLSLVATMRSGAMAGTAELVPVGYTVVQH